MQPTDTSSIMYTVHKTDKLCIIRQREEEKATESETVTKKESYTERQIVRPSYWTFFHYHEPRQPASLLTAISPDNPYYDGKHY